LIQLQYLQVRLEQMLRGFEISRVAMSKALLPALFVLGLNAAAPSIAQAPATAAPAASQRGTVKAVAGNAITVATDAGQQVTVTLTDTAKVVQLPPGSTDLKAATPATAADIAVGDRILATGKAGDAADKFTAGRVILMKSGDIAQKHAAEQADWQKRGSGGLVTAADPASGTFTIAVGAKKVEVKTTPTTIYRRYSGGSVKFEDAVPGTVADLHVGDQLRVRGAKSEDGSSIQAEEIVSGSFANLAGLIASINPADNTITMKDLTTKKTMTIKVTPSSELHDLPESAANRFAQRAKGGSAAGAAGAPPAGGGAPAAGGAPRGPGGQGGQGGGGFGGGGRSAGADLSQMVSRLPPSTFADLKVGKAAMIVASQTSPSNTTVTAVTLLTGVEPILAASPDAASATFSGWNVGGGGGGEGGGGGPQ
jgi:co-chaperonin GroES (HSP10)